MKRTFPLALFILLPFSIAMPFLASADSSHARIVRLSLVQGDVRFAREFHNDPLTDSKAVWENAPLNLPIRQGNVLSTGNGRAEVEFEDGAMAFLGANTILEFYDLSLNDGARVTRLILRQGSASFYDRSLNGDYFSVTGGDFTVEVSGRATFRLENFDNGSTVTVQTGRVNVLQGDNATPLEKGHSLSIQASDPANQVVTQAATDDDFDRWVSNRIQNEQVVNSQPAPGNGVGSSIYAPGYADLYTYGSWLNVGGTYCWRPFGLGWAWNPFNDGNWIYDASIGWSFIGYYPWGWLPYHYGGWNYFSGVGWAWNPGNTFYGRPHPYRPVTAVFVRSGNTVGLVPMNVADKSGKAPLNLTAQGVYPLENGTVSKPVTISSTAKLSVLKSPQSTELSARTAAVAPPTRLSRTIAPTTLAARETSFGHGSSIVYDPNEHRFVNANVARVAEAPSAAVPTNELRNAGKNPSSSPAAAATSPRSTSLPVSSRASALPPRPPAAPAPARTGGSGSGWGGSQWGGGGSPVGGSSRSSGSSSGSASHPSGGGGSSGGGGRPH